MARNVNNKCAWDFANSENVLFRFSSEIGVSDIECLPLKENIGAPSQKQLFIFLVFGHSGLVT